MKKLIIAEKPSVAADIAKALGGFTKHAEYFESDDFFVSSAVGHLLELKCPEEFEVKRGKWSFANLPVIPPRFDLNPVEKTVARLKVLTKLIKNKEVTGIINACDAGREGELIFHYIIEHAKTTKPVQRLWLQSMTPQSIRDGFKKLRTSSQMQGLTDAAICRSESDWLVGINGTRAMTAFNSKTGGFHLTTVGRVQTPTLALMVDRESLIKKFKSRDFWELEATFKCAEGEYKGKWFDEKFKVNKDDEHLRANRLWDVTSAENIQQKCAKQEGIVSEEAKPSTQLSPLLFDLTSLQREANSRFGFSAKTTLGIAQALYEKHKVLTYPRTDARALPEDYLDTVKQTLHILTGEGAGKGGDLMIANYAPFAHQILARNWVMPNKRIFNNAKISDHFAIIPTTQAPKALSEIEQKLYDLVTKRFLAVFYPAAEYLITTRITRVLNEPFKTEGKVLVKPGWLAIYGKANLEGEDSLVSIKAGETAQTKAIDLLANKTKPPARYSEATLLSAMEGAGKTVEDEELKAAMDGRGLGTPATRAQIIENLITEQYILRDMRELIPTAKAFSLMTLLNGLGVSELTAAELTGEWEAKLARMERGELTRKAFMAEIAAMTERIVELAKTYDSDTIPGDFGQLKEACPKCGGLIKETYKKFQCTKCDYALWKIVASRQFEAAEIDALLKNGRIGPLTGFRSKMGRAFSAELVLNDDKMPAFDFGDDKSDASEPVDFSGKERLGDCPKCASSVFELGSSYICEKATGPEKSCDFRSGMIILQQEVNREQMQKLLLNGRTDLLKNFVSSRTKRKFSAFLVRAKDGKVGFEFEPRKTPVKAEKSAEKSAEKPATKDLEIKTEKPVKKAAAPKKVRATKKA